VAVGPDILAALALHDCRPGILAPGKDPPRCHICVFKELQRDEPVVRRCLWVGENVGQLLEVPGAEEVGDDDDVLILLAPQSMVGASIYEPLKEMADAAVARGKALILLNPLLQDRQSSSGVMGVRGRSERLAFAESFEEVYHFRLLYSGTTFSYPVLGAVRMSRPIGGMEADKYVLFQRRESSGAESYEPVGCFAGREPTKEEITALVPRTVRPLANEGALASSDGSDGSDGAEEDEAPLRVPDPTWE